MLFFFQNITNDVDNLNLIAFTTSSSTDILAKVYTDNPEHYKTLQVNVFRETHKSGLIYTIRIDPSSYKLTESNNIGLLVHLSSVPLDNKLYSVQIESTLAQFNKIQHAQYFTSNSSFKFLTLNFVADIKNSEQQIKQTSVWSLLFIFNIMVVIYNIDKITLLLKEWFIKVNSTEGFTIFKIKHTVRENIADINDIDQIVQNINAIKQKVKSKKI